MRQRSNFPRLWTPNKTGQITCYKPGQIVCLQHWRLGVLTLGTTDYYIGAVVESPALRFRVSAPQLLFPDRVFISPIT